MAVNIWWYEKRGQWCADVPTAEGRKRLYLGANKAQAQAALHRYMAEYYERLGEEGDDSSTTARRNKHDSNIAESYNGTESISP